MSKADSLDFFDAMDFFWTILSPTLTNLIGWEHWAIRRCCFRFLGALVFLDEVEGMVLVRVWAKSKKIN
jgi:hypothetical protein